VTDGRISIDFGTAWSKAVVAPAAASTGRHVRVLPIGADFGDRSLMAPCALFVGDRRIQFARQALNHAAAAAGEGREALLSVKNVLSAHDLQSSLAMATPPRIDPTQSFLWRDLLVFFLAWLLARINHAVDADESLQFAGRRPPIRYTRPGWRLAAVAEHHRIVSRLFDEADHIAASIGDMLLHPDGVPIEIAADALSAARQADAPSRVEACVFEAVAAALCHAMSDEDKTPEGVWLVLDIGAGTTDLAAIELGAGGVQEIEPARRTLTAAGDLFDQILLDLYYERFGGGKAKNNQATAWRQAKLAARDHKEELFEAGKSEFSFQGRKITLGRGALENDDDFREARAAIEEAYRLSLDDAANFARAKDAKQIRVVLAGGGARLAFASRMAARQPAGGRVRARIAPLVPSWAKEPPFSAHVAKYFPQFAIAIGCALAPANLLAADET
jgi:hypothetical protein